MGVSAGPVITASNLRMYLDAANVKSYSGSGVTVNDLSGNNKNGTLQNSPTFSTLNKGRFDLDGINDVINIGTGNTFFPLNEFTIEVWFRSTGITPTTGTFPGIFGGTYGLRLFVYSNRLEFGVDQSALSTLKTLSTQGSFSFHDGSWNYVACQASSNTMKIYVNGNLNNETSVAWTGTTRWPTNSFQFGRDMNNSNYFFTGSMASIKIYNSILSASEIYRNFNASRGRFGL